MPWSGPCLPLKALTFIQAHISVLYELTIQYIQHFHWCSKQCTNSICAWQRCSIVQSSQAPFTRHLPSNVTRIHWVLGRTWMYPPAGCSHPWDLSGGLALKLSTPGDRCVDWMAVMLAFHLYCYRLTHAFQLLACESKTRLWTERGSNVIT